MARRIHFIGIGGVGMAALAFTLKQSGYEVSGCDLKETPRTRQLVAAGISVAIGHHADHIQSADEVIVTPAIATDNPEFVAARAAAAAGHLILRTRGEVLAALSATRETIAVCGSHGKTTTTTFTTKLLAALGEDPSWAIGGETGALPVAGAGKGPFVVEADESDGTLALYRPALLVVTNCEYDHPDHFPTPAAYRACFETVRARSKAVIEGEALPCDFASLFADLGSVGDNACAAVSALAAHNQRNARMAIEVALRRGHPRAAIAAALPHVVAELPDRRFEVAARHADGTPRVVTDYAHHPTEIACAIRMARAVTKGTLRVLFQPHRYSRTRALLAAFPAALQGADEVVLCPTYAAFEKPLAGGDIADLYAACRATANFPRLFLAPTMAAAWRHAQLEERAADLTLLLGAGTINQFTTRVASELEIADRSNVPARSLAKYTFFGTAGYSYGGGARRIVGMGSNTWISDLSTDCVYEKASTPNDLASDEVPASLAGAALGIPWMSGIPGTVGGWVKMNAGACGHTISEWVRAVRVSGVWRTAAECGFGYRTSKIDGVIEAVRWAFPDKWEVSAEECVAKRKTFPPRTCGSVFKNPPGDFAGALLEASGVKGLRVGGAFVWSQHANVIVADMGATASDILALARLMRAAVYFRTGIRLEPEITGLDEALKDDLGC